LPTLAQALAIAWSRDITKKATCGVSVGERETRKGKRFTMSEQKAKVQKKSNLRDSAPALDGMSRPQALAVSWTGLEALAKQKQLIICNDKTTQTVWFGIANAKVVSVGKDKDGNDLYDLLEWPLPTVTANG